MSPVLLIVIFIIVGILAGILAGMLGVGGGIIFVPALYSMLPLFNVNHNQLSYIVIGTSLFCIAITSFSSALNHYILKNVNLKFAILLSIGSITSSLLSVYYVVLIDPKILHYIFAVVFIAVAIRMFFSSKTNEQQKNEHYLKSGYAVLFGVFVGIFIAFTGLGGGVLIVPILIYIFGVKTKTAIGTSALTIFATTIAAAISFSFHSANGNANFLQVGFVYLLAGIPIGLGAAFGARQGVKLAVKSHPEKLKKYFSVLLIIIVVKITIGLL